MYADVKPELILWACERSGYSMDILEHKFSKLSAWIEGSAKPTLKQLENFANSTHAPIGFFFLSEPPVEILPLPDFRTIANGYLRKPSPNLLDTIYICQQRQEWYREYAKMNGMNPLDFVGSFKEFENIQIVAEKIRNKLEFDVEKRKKLTSWESALSHFIEKVENSGILVMRSGVYLNNNYRHLDVEEFRGFSISDKLAPLIFINGADTKAAQMFTLAHEVAHIWLGVSGVTDTQPSSFSGSSVEKWCNAVAAEILVPVSSIEKEFNSDENLKKEMSRLAKFYKVSTLVILRRIYDIGAISQDKFRIEYKNELERLKSFADSKGSGGGDFYANQKYKISSSFAKALLISTLEGNTLHRDAFKL
ncbi:MAG TPA: ImmA/IrrE family metallo-endopeptidase, partial [bacterium]|nr:ImmA/IrrE family metallo-endopeptidase [bacterium]